MTRWLSIYLFLYIDKDNNKKELVKVSLEDLYSGKDMQVKYTRNTICPHCRGTGADDPSDVKTCTKCNG